VLLFKRKTMQAKYFFSIFQKAHFYRSRLVKQIIIAILVCCNHILIVDDKR